MKLWTATFCLLQAGVATASSPSLVLRFRLTDGSIKRVSVEANSNLGQVADQIFNENGSRPELNGKPLDTSSSLSELNLKNGALLTTGSAAKKNKHGLQKAKSKTSNTKRFDPFPDLARDYKKAKTLASRRRTSGGGLSYSDLASMQSNLFVVEPQSEGPLLRTYMCRYAAEQFQANAIVKQKIKNRCGLLLGTLQRERVDRKPRPKTSLSTPLSDSDYCQVCKIHAIWEPPSQKPKSIYDSEKLMMDAQVLRVAGYLGLRPVGWIFTYNDKRQEDTDGLPVLGRDIDRAAKLQIENMKSDIVDGARFATLSMDAETGATEAFQISDVAVQMVAQETLVDPDARYVDTVHPVIVDGKETTNLDSVLCLVNTALLSHEGSYTHPKSTTKKNGTLSNKTVKRLVTSLKSSNDSKTLEILRDFNLLLAMDRYLTESESRQLAESVRKWARGQRQRTQLDETIRTKLLSRLE